MKEKLRKNLFNAFPACGKARALKTRTRGEHLKKKTKRGPCADPLRALCALFPPRFLFETCVGQEYMFVSRALAWRIVKKGSRSPSATPNLAGIDFSPLSCLLSSFFFSVVGAHFNLLSLFPTITGRLLPLRAPARQGLRRARPQAPCVVVQPPQDRAHHGLE